jgi:hypothetical protein
MDTKEVKLMVISRWKTERSTVSGRVKLALVCVPALRKMLSIVGYVLKALQGIRLRSDSCERCLLVDKGWNFIELRDVEGDARGRLLAVLCDKVVETLLSSADSGDLDAVPDEVVCHSSANATGRTNKEYVSVWERHGARCSGSVFGDTLEATRLIVYICISCSFPSTLALKAVACTICVLKTVSASNEIVSPAPNNVRSGVHTSLASHILLSVASLFCDL